MKTKIDDLTIGEAKELCSLLSGNNQVFQQETSHPYAVNEKYFIRTVTHHFVGLLVDVKQGELVLTEASWVASDGRFADMLKTGKFDEVEPFPEKDNVIINRSSIIDAVRFNHPLPTSQK